MPTDFVATDAEHRLQALSIAGTASASASAGGSAQGAYPSQRAAPVPAFADLFQSLSMQQRQNSAGAGAGSDLGPLQHPAFEICMPGFPEVLVSCVECLHASATRTRMYT